MLENKQNNNLILKICGIPTSHILFSTKFKDISIIVKL